MITNELAKAIHLQNKTAGWWDEPVRPDGTTIALIHSELSESYAGRGVFIFIEDEHLPQYANWLVELADAAIRIYDFFGFKEWDVELALAFVKENGIQDLIVDTEEDNTYATYICEIHAHVSNALEGLRKDLHVIEKDNDIPVAAVELAAALSLIYATVNWGYDLPGIIHDKRAYNARRADHKRENRAKANGKKF